jgi:hypothetical protein
VSEADSLVKRLITVIKQHKKPSSPKSTAVLLKIMEKQILQPDHSVAEFKAELQRALKSSVLLSELIRQQHSEEEIRNCFTQLLIALESPAGEPAE